MKRYAKSVTWIMLWLIVSLALTSGLSAAEQPKEAKAPVKAITPVVVGDSQIMERTPVVRVFAVRCGLMKLRMALLREGRNDEAATVTKALRNRDVLEAVAESVCIAYSQDMQGVPVGSWVDELTQLFEWILAHADEIIAIIMLFFV